MGVIYQIRIDGGSRTYIGSAQDFPRRKRMHLWMMKRGNHHCIGLRRAIAKHGIGSVSWNILEDVDDDELLVREQDWLDRWKGKLYNTSPTASSVLGLKKTSDQIERSAKHHRGKVVSEDTRAKLSRAMRGNTNGRHTGKPFCGKGHPMSGINLYLYKIASGSTRRACKICMWENSRRNYAKNHPNNEDAK